MNRNPNSEPRKPVLKAGEIPHSRPWISVSDVESVRANLLTGMIAQGNGVRAFEEAVASAVGAAGGVASASGTTALVQALRALGIRSQQEVILPTYVCSSVLDAVRSVDATPVLCDVGPSWTMTSQNVARELSSRTAAVILVDLFGIPAEREGMFDLGFPVIEDCCQSFGARCGDRAVGTFGAVGIFSFHAVKCLTSGEGGMAVSTDAELVHRMRTFRDGEWRNHSREFRSAGPMTDMQAALGLSQLRRYEEFLNRRRALTDYYVMTLGEFAVLPFEGPAPTIPLYRFPLRTSGDFELTQAAFRERGVTVRRGVDSLLHREMGLSSDRFVNAEKRFRETISIPFYPSLSDSEAERVVDACRTILKK